MNLKQKFLLSIILTATLVLLVFSVFMYRQSVETIEQNYIDSANGSLYVCAGTFDVLMREAYFSAVDAASADGLEALIEQKDTDGIEQLLKLYLTGNIDSVYCYLPGQVKLVRATHQGTRTEACTSNQIIWVQHLQREIANPLQPVSIADELGTIRKQVFVYGQPITSEHDGRKLGYIITTVDERIVYFKCLQNSQPGLKGTVYITTEDGMYASGSNLNKLGEKEAPAAENEIKTSVQASLTGYIFHSVMNRNIITSDIQQTRRKIISFALLLILLSCIPVGLLVRSMMKPLKELEYAMEKVGQGDLTAQAAIYHDDEIGRVSEGFNSMVKELDATVGELVTQKMLKKEAEIEALKYQIQPHFIYNTLNSIKFAAALQKANEIAELLEAFIQLMQLTASDRGTFIPLEQEIHMAENYAKLQLFRYANGFTVEYDIMPDTKRCYVPSLILQPLIENAILHGINVKNHKGKIQISAMLIVDMLVIRVQDNGRGMTAEDMRRLMEGKQRSKFSGIGIGNIRERLALYYGSKAELRFYSQSGSGTTAIITLPISKENPNSSDIGSMDAMRQILTEYPDVKGVFCTSAMMVLGAMQERKRQGYSGVELIGVDAQSDALLAVEQGEILAMIGQDGYQIGYQTVKTIVQALHGEQVQDKIFVDNALITQENVKEYLEK